LQGRVLVVDDVMSAGTAARESIALIQAAGATPHAVAIALEDVTPSGQVSVEHIQNVLARLRSPPTPELAQTDLQLLEAPRADTARYDRLRDIEQQTVEAIHER
jgi:predicted aconitase